jgi:hypothetical protein
MLFDCPLDSSEKWREHSVLSFAKIFTPRGVFRISDSFGFLYARCTWSDFSVVWSLPVRRQRGEANFGPQKASNHISSRPCAKAALVAVFSTATRAHYPARQDGCEARGGQPEAFVVPKIRGEC